MKKIGTLLLAVFFLSLIVVDTISAGNNRIGHPRRDTSVVIYNSLISSIMSSIVEAKTSKELDKIYEEMVKRNIDNDDLLLL